MQIKCTTLFSAVKINHNWAGMHNHRGNLMTHFVFGSQTPKSLLLPICVWLSKAVNAARCHGSLYFSCSPLQWDVSPSENEEWHIFRPCSLDPVRCLLLRWQKSDSLTLWSPVILKFLSQSWSSKRYQVIPLWRSSLCAANEYFGTQFLNEAADESLMVSSVCV